ncbi:MAG: polysaccharide biosynthesis/export family protein [Longimicrobiales bacterium]
MIQLTCRAVRSTVRSPRIVLMALAVLLLQPLRASAQTPETAPVLRAGDVIQIRVWRNPELSGEFAITDRGTLAHPLYSEIRAAGREITEIREDLRAFLSNYLEKPNFVVEALFPVLVGGEVRLPNVYKLTSETTVARAVSLAGGPTTMGRLDRVILRRDGRRQVVDLASEQASDDFVIRSGDEIIVTGRANVFRDYIAPSASIVAALATVYRLINP